MRGTDLSISPVISFTKSKCPKFIALISSNRSENFELDDQ